MPDPGEPTDDATGESSQKQLAVGEGSASRDCGAAGARPAVKHRSGCSKQ